MKTRKLIHSIQTWFCCAGLFIVAGSCSDKIENDIDLSGKWMFRIDSLDIGVEERWFEVELDDTIKLPGSMNSNGKGFDISLGTKWTGSIVDSTYFTEPEYAKYREPGNFKVPFWLQPLKHYVGAAWYQKEVDIPRGWDGQHIELFLERCHWETQIWVDNQRIGSQNLLGSPHVYDLSKVMTPGNHMISIRVDNRIKDMNVGKNSHSVSDHTQTNWNGIVGKIALQKKATVYLDEVQITPDIDKKLVSVRITINNTYRTDINGQLQLSATSFNSGSEQTIANQASDIVLPSGWSTSTLVYKMGDDPLLWDEFTPNLYKLKVELATEDGKTLDERAQTFGMREIETKDRKILVNGRPVFLRGTLECAIFPKTGYPSMEMDAWQRIYKVVKSYGLNHVRFHSWCPPEVAFEAADMAGVYLQVENSSWANQGATVGDSLPIDKFLYKETEYNLKNYGNHPSFCLMAYGNEPAGNNQDTYLKDYVNHWKAIDNRRIYTSAAGWPAIPENDFHLMPAPRIQHWGAGLSSIINSKPPQTLFDFEDVILQFKQPVISHEIGQWCVYPNFKEIDKYDGVLRARNFEIFQETLTEHNMAHLADSFLLASGKLQSLCYKADIEAALRTNGQAGFELLDLHDFPGQGTALVGVLDPFWEEKGYITAEEYSKFCNATVPLARIPKRVFLNNEATNVDFEVAHFGKENLINPDVRWSLSLNGGEVIREGKFEVNEIPIGNGIQLGRITLELSEITTPQKLKLTAYINDRDNSWDLWVYPSELPNIGKNDEEIKVVQNLDQRTIKFIEEGGNVLLTPKKGSVKNEKGGSVQVGFSSIFWNTAWTGGQAPHTLGILCNPTHPALELFPTEYHSNWQWWDAMSHSNAIVLSDFDPELKPIVRIIDDWVTNRPLGLIFELKVGKGKILMTGIDLLSDQENRLEAQQLLKSLKAYMLSDNFKPAVEAEISDILGLLNIK